MTTKLTKQRATQITLKDWKLPALLLALSLVPTLGGIARLSSMSVDSPITSETARFVAAPVPIIIHVVSATLYSLLGAFQFSKVFRLRWPGFHRRAGRVLAVAGLLAGLTGVWMTAMYPIPATLQGPILWGVRLVVGLAMVASIIIAWSSILHRDVARHEAFMIRAYAIAQGAGTQVLVLGPWMLLTGQGDGLVRDLLMALSWAINIGVAELIVRGRTQRLANRHAQRELTNVGSPGLASRDLSLPA
jgi:hypothetical protein